MDETRVVTTEPHEKPLELIPLISYLFRKWVWIAAAAIAFAVAAFAGIELFATPVYRSEFMAYISNHTSVSDETGMVTAENLNASRILADTYAALISSRGFLEQASLRAGIDIPADKLCSMVEAETVADTELLLVSVTDPNPYVALAIAQAIADEAVIQIEEIVDGSSMSVIQKPELPLKSCAPKTVYCVAFAAILGVVTAVCVITLVYVLDVYIDLSTLEKDYGYPVLACVAKKGVRCKGIGKTANSRSERETFRMLRMGLAAQWLGSEKQCVAVSCADREKDKSAVSIKIASALAQSGKHVLLIDCAVETAYLTAWLSLDEIDGLGDYLAGRIPLAEVGVRRINGVDVIAAGNSPQVSGAFLGSARMGYCSRKPARNMNVSF